MAKKLYNPDIMMSAKEFSEYVQDCERKAQIAVLKEIKPFGNGKRIQKLIDQIKEGKYKYRCPKTRRRCSSPKEVVVEVGPGRRTKTVQQYMVREQ